MTNDRVDTIDYYDFFYDRIVPIEELYLKLGIPSKVKLEDITNDEKLDRYIKQHIGDLQNIFTERK
ncbi:hypothetical protein AB1L07_02220 [Niallia alba]|uniref:hypothetical protein n=1 Tax=Niallia alba TaxID=2729105 RepID=UPI0039A07ACE